MADSQPNDTYETAQYLGEIGYNEDFWNANLALVDSASLFGDPVDYFRVQFTEEVASVSFNLSFTNNYGNSYPDYYQYVVITVPGSGSYGIKLDGGTSDGTLDNTGFTEAYRFSTPIIAAIIPGGELIFSVRAGAGIDGTLEEIDSRDPELNDPFVGYELSISVFEGVEETPPLTSGEVIVLGDGGESAEGSNGNDSITGGSGDDILDGGDGIDTAFYSEDQEVYSLLYGPDIEIIDRSGVDGKDILRDIEVLNFGGSVTFDLELFDDVAALGEVDFLSLAEMYIAYFDRAPDALGLMFWADARADGMELSEIASSFAQSTEAQATFANVASTSELVDKVYQNVLGRSSDAAGGEFWTNAIDNGSVTQADFILSLLGGARATSPDGATEDFLQQQQADLLYLDAKTDVGVYFSSILGMSNVSNAADVMQLYNGTPSSISAAISAADADYVGASASDGSGEFLIQLAGIIDNPFA